MSELSNLDVQTKEKIEGWIEKLIPIKVLIKDNDISSAYNRINSLIKEMKEEIE